MAEDNTPTVHQVGASFVSQYYKTLATQPLILYKFYKDVSHFTHGIEGEDPLVAHGQTEIKNSIQELDFSDCKVKLSVVDCQKSQDGSVVVVVQGYLSNCGSAPRRFTQTFVLAVQPKGYYVYNDVFRYLSNDIPISAYASSGSAEQEVNGSNNERYEVDSTSATVGTVDEPFTSAEEREYASDHGEAAEDEQQVEEQQEEAEVKPVSKPKKKNRSKKNTAEHQAIQSAEPKIQENMAEAEREVVSDGPRTFASIVAGPGYAPPHPVPSKKEEQKDKSGKRSARKDDRKERKEGRQSERNDKTKRQHNYVFVKNLEKGTTDKDLRKALENFGEITLIENKASEKGNASVAFSSFDAMKAALNAGSTNIEGKKVPILKKRFSFRSRRGRPNKTFTKKQPESAK